MATTNQRIRYDLEAAVSGQQDVAALARQLEGLADTLEGDLKTQALASAGALRELGAKQGAIDNFVKLKGEAGAAATRLKEAQTAAQQLGQQLAATGTPTRAQAGQMEKLRDAVRSAKTEVQEKTRALDNSRATLTAYGVSSNNVAQAERTTRQAIGQAREEVAKLAPAYNAAGNAAAASGSKQTKSAQEVRSALAGVGDTLRTIQNIALTAVGGTFLTSLARDVGAVADQYNNLRARLSLVTGEGPALEAAFEAVRQVALQTSSDLESTVTLFGRIAQAGKEFGVSQQQSLELTRTIGQAIQVSGGSAESANAAIVQLVQGLQSGVLRGEEFNSVMEQAPRLARALADGLGVTTGELRAMAQQGRLTTEVVLTALQGQAEAVQNEFEKLPPTIGRALENLQTQWISYVGNVDKATNSSQSAAKAIAAIGENLDSIVGVAIRAASGVQAAWGVMVAGANTVLGASYAVGAAFATMAQGVMSGLATLREGLSKVTFGGLSAGFKEAADDARESAGGFGAAADALASKAKQSLGTVADAAQTARNGWSGLIGEVGESAPVFEKTAKSAAGLGAAVEKLGFDAETGLRKVNISLQDQVEAYEAAAIAKRGDAQAAEANLRVQLQLARQSEELARFMGNESGVRQAKIAQMQIEIQIAQARVQVMRAEAEGSIAIAQAKLADMQASGNVSLVKEAELQNTIKLAQAKLAEADATGKATELMQRQLEQFKNGTAGADGYGRSLDALSGKQNKLEAATRSATAALREQAQANSRYASPLGADKFSAPAGGSVTGSNRAERLAGQNAVDNTLQFALRDKLNAGTLTADDVDALQAAIAALRQREAIDRDVDRMNPAGFSNEGMRDRLEWQRIRARFEEAANSLAGGAPGSAPVGRSVAITLRTSNGTETINTDEAGAAALVRSLQAAGLSAKG